MSDLKRDRRNSASSKDLPKVDQISSFEEIPQFFNRIIEEINTKFKRVGLTTNFDCDLIKDVEIAAGAAVKIRHRLNVVPSYRIILRQSGGAAITDVNSGWDDKYIELQNTGATNAIITVAIYKE